MVPVAVCVGDIIVKVLKDVKTVMHVYDIVYYGDFESDDDDDDDDGYAYGTGDHGIDYRINGDEDSLLFETEMECKQAYEAICRAI